MNFTKSLNGCRFFSFSKYVLPDLLYDYKAFEPYLSSELIELHHNKHHRAYVTNFNLTIEKYNQPESSLCQMDRINLLKSIKFYAGGSGWCWLVKIPLSQRLFIETTMNQDLAMQGKVILGIDAWEHAYYAQYFNNKVKYFENIWNVVNWKVMNKRFEE
ncbi:hypothetical protein PCK1_002115 [Pneumocystis canis]|nr:hypothetical protein PCK1_002115 [Pneumocystis canis]